MTGRLASSVIASGLIRLAEQDGGFGAVLSKGDPTAGAILIILLERGERRSVLERLLLPDGRYGWRDSPGVGRAGRGRSAERCAERRRRATASRARGRSRTSLRRCPAS